MWKLAALALLLLLGCEPAKSQPFIGPSPVICQSFIAATAATTTMVRILQAAAGKVTYLCGWNASDSGAGAGAFTLSYGTGTNCATGTVQIGSTIALAANGFAADHRTYAWAALPVGADVCWTVTGTGQIGLTLYYGQYGP